jgi:plasmid stabilization system protein ParE
MADLLKEARTKLQVSDRSELADTDLIDIWINGAQNCGQLTAESYFSDINQTFQFLAETPYEGSERTEFKPPVHIHTAILSDSPLFFDKAPSITPCVRIVVASNF